MIPSPSLLDEIRYQVADAGFQSLSEERQRAKILSVWYLLARERMMISETEVEIMRVLREMEKRGRLEI